MRVGIVLKLQDVSWSARLNVTRPCLIPQAARASEMSHPAYTIVAMTYGYDLDEREVLRITVNCI